MFVFVERSSAAHSGWLRMRPANYRTCRSRMPCFQSKLAGPGFRFATPSAPRNPKREISRTAEAVPLEPNETSVGWCLGEIWLG
jgi:hypothetical protein